MKKIIMLAVAFIFIKTAFTQKTNKSAFAEIGGPGLVASVNYDTRFAKKANGFGGRVGVGYVSDLFASAVTVPLEINYLAGKSDGKHFLELGAGTTFVSGKELTWTTKDDSKFSAFIEHVTVGYRYQPKRGFFFHAIICPVFSDGSAFWAGLGAGVSF